MAGEVTAPGVSPKDIAPGLHGFTMPKGLRFRDLMLQIYLQRQKYDQQAFDPFLGFEKGIGEQRAKYDQLVYDSIANPTASPAYQLNLKEGLDAIGARNAALGSSVSGPSQIAQGRFAQGLAGDEMDKANARLMAASQFRGILPQTQEPQYFQNAVGTHGARASWLQAGASLMQAQAAKQAASGGGGGMGFSDLLGTGLGLLGGPSKALGTAGDLFGISGRPAGVEGPLMQGGSFFSNPLTPFLNMGSKLTSLWGPAAAMIP